MNGLYATLERYRPYILSILRIVVGLLFLEHGLSKVFNFPAPSPVASLSGLLILAAILETIGAALFLVGAFTRIVAFILSGEMAFAYFMAHAPRSFYPLVNGGELAVIYCFIFLYFAFAGRRSAERRSRGAEPGLSRRPQAPLSKAPHRI
jgi:putative oxidoreductase